MPERDCEISESSEELINMMKNEKKGSFRDRLRRSSGVCWWNPKKNLKYLWGWDCLGFSQI